MKFKIIVAFGLLLLCFSSAYSAEKIALPFVGKRSFNFYGGNGTENSIVIKKDGSTVIKAHGTTGSSILYKGKFSNPIISKDGEGWLFKGNKVFALSNGKIEKGCSGEETAPCESELYK